MTQWTIIALLLLTSVILPPLALWWLCQRSRFAPFFQSLSGVLAPFLGIVGIIFGLNVVFICNDIWQTREVAKVALAHEAEGLRNIGRLATTIPGQGGVPILNATYRYLEAIIDADFARNKGADSNSIANNATLPLLIELSYIIWEPKNFEQLHPTIQPLLMEELKEARDRRFEREASVDIKPNKIKWLLVIYLEFMTLLSIVACHITNGRALLVACFLFLGAVNPYLAVLYASQSPFAGLDPLKDTVFVACLERVKLMKASYEAQASETNKH